MLIVHNEITTRKTHLRFKQCLVTEKKQYHEKNERGIFIFLRTTYYYFSFLPVLIKKVLSAYMNNMLNPNFFFFNEPISVYTGPK
jgi:hypothetical protein